ncbi:uncharacterized protein DMENIID0001_054860 [Sergentomyia squamirostris]
MTTINSLPDEVLEFILDLLPPYKDLENCQLVAKHWAELVRNVRFRKVINFQRAIRESNLCWQLWHPGDVRTPAARYSHAVAVYKGFMYVFGGGSNEVTTFNDLWAFDLSTRTWERCNSHGPHPYPSPKARATMVCHEDRLIVFGGLRYPPKHPPYQRICLFDELHVYNLAEKHWMIPKMSTPWPPAMAGHSATIHGRQMVIFGGLQETTFYVANSNDVWSLDLDTFTWRKHETSGQKPAPRIDHYQIRIDDENLLIVGGLGGANSPFTDMWLLTMTSPTWTWREIPVRQRNFAATRMWTNPACEFDQKLIVLGQNCTLPADLQVNKQMALNSGGVQRIHQQPQQQAELRLRNPHQDPPNAPVDPRPAGGGNLRGRQHLEEAVPEIRPLARRGEHFGLQNLPRAPAHYHMGMLAFRESWKSQLTRERRLSALQKHEDELKARQAVIQAPPPPKLPVKEVKKPRQNCEAIFICDLSRVLDTADPSAEWLEPREGGVCAGAPLKNIMSSLVVGNGELICFGGLEQSVNCGNHTANNHLHFITVPHSVI